MSYSIGLDISKKLISVHIPINKSDLEIENNLNSIKKLYSKLKKLYKKDINKLIFIFEPTGSYSAILTRFCNEKNIQCFLINPKQFSNHLKALGERVKSDKVDARVLSSALHLAKDNEIRIPSYNKVVEEIKELMGYYKFVSKQRSKAINHLESLVVKNGSPYAISDLQRAIANHKKKQNNILKKIHSIIQKDEELLRGYNNIKTITGIGEIGAIVLLHLFIKYPKANRNQITSLVGLDPAYKSSGTSVQSKPKISKAGSKLYRGTLFLGAMTAINHDENFNHFFNRLVSNGKHTTVGQIAVMKKMIVIAHSLYKNDKQYDKEFYEKATGRSEK